MTARPPEDAETVRVKRPRMHHDAEGRSPTERMMRCNVCGELYVSAPGIVPATLAPGEYERLTARCRSLAGER